MEKQDAGRINQERAVIYHDQFGGKLIKGEHTETGQTPCVCSTRIIWYYLPIIIALLLGQYTRIISYNGA